MKVFVSIPKNSEVLNTFMPKDAKEHFERLHEVTYSEYDRQPDAAEFSEWVKDADAVITGWGHPMITYDMLKGTNVKVIAHTGGSVGSLIGDGVYENGIRVISGNILYAESVAEGVIAYMLSGLRAIPYYVNAMKKGEWYGSRGFYSEGLLDRTVGIIGFGTISRYLIKMLQNFRAKIKVYSSHKIDEEYLKENNAVQSTIEDIFSTCKIVSLHSAMTEKTRGMIGKEHFELLSDGALFINTARGGIIRENEMIDALRGKKFCAVLDVYCHEPLEADSELRKLENVYCIPHMGGPTLDRRPYITKKLADNLAQFERAEDMELEIKSDAAKRMTR